MKIRFFNNRLASAQRRLGYRAGVLGLGERCRCCLPQAVLLLVAVVFASGNQSVVYGQQQETAESSGPIVEDEDPQVRIGDLVQEGESADLELAPPLVPRPDFEPLEIRQALVPTQQSSGSDVSASRTMGREIASGRMPADGPSVFDRSVGTEITSELGGIFGEGDESDSETRSAEQMNSGKKLKPSVNLTVELQSDLAFFTQDDTNVATVKDIPDGAFFRRSRLGIYGELYETVEYRLEYDFASDERPRFLDNWVALTNLPLVGNLIAGHYFEPFRRAAVRNLPELLFEKLVNYRRMPFVKGVAE